MAIPGFSPPNGTKRRGFPDFRRFCWEYCVAQVDFGRPMPDAPKPDSQRPMLAPPVASLWPERLRTLLCLILLMGVSLPACNCPVLPMFSRSKPPVNSGNTSAPAVSEVEPAYRDAWDAVRAEIARDPKSPAIVTRADALLALLPPLELQVGALVAKSQQAYRVGEDFLAVRWCQDAQRRMEQHPQDGVSSALARDLARIYVMAAARGGDPAIALDRLDKLESTDTFSPQESFGIEAVALSRAKKIPAATLAFAEWRALLPENADAAYAEAQFSALSAQLSPSQIRALQPQAQSPLAKACLTVLVGDDAPPASPPWVLRCRDLPGRVGVLLPRSGRYSVFADSHFAAATAAIRVLAKERDVSVVWRNSTSTPQGAKAAALELAREGAEVIVGPVARSQIAAVAKALGEGTRIVVPGEPVAKVDAVAPSLRQRLRALLARARAKGIAKVVVMAPENSYGTRVKAALAKLRATSVISQISYPADTTSFRPFISPIQKQLGKGAAILIADSFPRAELIVRQLRRADLGADQGGPMVLLTAEGWSPSQIRGEHAVFESAVLAPVAAAGPESRAFVQEFRRQQGKEPDVQALLVWQAFAKVWRSQGLGKKPSAKVFEVIDEQISPVS